MLASPDPAYGQQRMPNTSRQFLLLGVLCAILAGLLFVPGLGGGFLLDDKPTISENSAVQITRLDTGSLMQAAYSYTAGGGTRPLPMLSFALDYWRSGLDPAAFKATNILIHALTTLALACFLRLLLTLAGWPPTRAGCAALGLATAWAIHPLQVSSVLYIVQRMQTLGTLFLVLALWSYLKMRHAQLEDQRSRQYGVLTGLFWMLALASKEDSVLLPAFTLALELTVLRFRAAQPALANGLRKGYLLFAVLGIAGFVLVVLPHYWSWDSYRYRDFSSPERLLTQARMLAMYLGQILLPLHGHLPFYYDWVQPSHSLLKPWTTLPALLLLVALLAAAWRLRRQRPLFALGILLFFTGHFITSNVLGLELAFEHRNHFPLIGAVIALGDLLAAGFTRLRLRPRLAFAACTILLAILGTATALRARTWATPLGLAQHSVQVAPHSERAWISLCRTNFELSAGKPQSPYFRDAIKACTKGAEIPYGASALASLVVLKAIDGETSKVDWARLGDRMQRVTMSPSNVGVALYLAGYSNHDDRIDPRNVVRIIDIVGQRSGYRPDEYAGFGYYAVRKELDADAYRYFARAVQTSPPNSRLVVELLADLRKEGRDEWADALAAMTPSQGALGYPR